MKKTLFLLVITLATLFFPGVLRAQMKVDSLINILNTQELKPDTQLVLYNKICLLYMQNDIEKYKTYTDKGLELANKEKNKSMIAKFNGNLGIFYYYKASYDTAFIYMEKALGLAQETGDKIYEARTYSNIALLYSMKGDYATEIEYDLKALSIYEQIDDKKTFTTLLVNIGTTYRSLKEYNRAIYYFDKAKKLADETNYTHGKLLVYYAFANVYWDKNESDKSLEYFLKSLEMSKAENNKDFEILCLQSLTTLYSEETSPLRDLKKAEEYAHESLQIANEFGNPFRIRGSLRVLAYICLNQKRYQDCVNLATQAWEIDSIDIDTSYGLASMLVVSNIHLGNKEKAAYYFQKYIELNGEKTNQNLQETLIGIEVKYETEKKELHIAALEKERTFYIWIGIIGGILLLSLLLLFIIRQRWAVSKRKLAEQQNILAEQQIKQLEQEKQIVAAQSVLDGETAERSRLARDLHDGLGGMLSVVRLNLDDVEHLQNAREMLDQSISELRRVAHHLMPESLLRYGLKASLDDFCASVSNVKFHYFGDDSRIDDRIEVLIYRCAHELVNNAIKYAKASTINIQLVQESDRISLTVQDDGCGFDTETVTPGMGLENLRIRVAACNGKIDIYSSPGKGTEVYVEIIL